MVAWGKRWLELHPLLYADNPWTGLTLGERGWFAEFSGPPLYSSTAVIPPQTETRFIREQYPMPFDDPGTMTMHPRQVSSPVLSGQQYSCCWYPCL
ncbi:hypothetical protein TNCV_5119041 [Trichonephila clavipes]|nr:hypothetical protein TNCV_5119041 [Trichonephila clavipes]